MPTAPATSRAADAEGVARVVAAARTCFARDGAAKTRMAAIAEEAGMVRQTVYSFVSSRAELLRLVLAERLMELAEVALTEVSFEGDIDDVLVEAFARVTEIVREDHEFGAVSEALGTAEAMRFLTGPSAAQEAALTALGPLHDRALEEQALRPGISVDDFAAWTRAVCSPLTARTDLEGEGLRDWLRKFALPPLLNDAALQARG